MEPCYEAKVFSIFKLFDVNGDRVLSREEMAVYAVSVNPVAKISDEEINAYLNEIFYTYGEIVDGKEGLTYAGLLFSYYDGFGDANRDFDTFAYDLKLIDLDPIENDISRDAEIEQATKREQATENHAKCSIECQGEIIEGLLESGNHYSFPRLLSPYAQMKCVFAKGDGSNYAPKMVVELKEFGKNLMDDRNWIHRNEKDASIFCLHVDTLKFGPRSSLEFLWDPGRFKQPEVAAEKVIWLQTTGVMKSPKWRLILGVLSIPFLVYLELLVLQRLCSRDDVAGEMDLWVELHKVCKGRGSKIIDTDCSIQLNGIKDKASQVDVQMKAFHEAELNFSKRSVVIFGYVASIFEHAEFFVRSLVYSRLVDNEFSPLLVSVCKTFGVTLPLRLVLGEILPIDGLVKVANVSSVAAKLSFSMYLLFRVLRWGMSGEITWLTKGLRVGDKTSTKDVIGTLLRLTNNQITVGKDYTKLYGHEECVSWTAQHITVHNMIGIALVLGTEDCKRLTYSPIYVKTGLIVQANGSAKVKNMEVTTNVGRSSSLQSDKGKFSIYIDSGPTIMPEELFSQQFIALQGCLLDGKIVAGVAIDPSSLMIVKGRICWDLYIKSLVISSDEYLLNASGVANKAVLSDIDLPRVDVAGVTFSNEQLEVDVSGQELPKHIVILGKWYVTVGILIEMMRFPDAKGFSPLKIKDSRGTTYAYHVPKYKKIWAGTRTIIGNFAHKWSEQYNYTWKVFDPGLRERHKKELESLTLTSQPLKTSKLFILAVIQYLKRSVAYFLTHGGLLMLLSIVMVVVGVLLLAIDGPHGMHVEELLEYVRFALWWVAFGVASSIGLGSGLHTFVLYLGPHIAFFTIKAMQCGRVDLKSAPYDTIQLKRGPSWLNKDCSEFGPPLFSSAYGSRVPLSSLSKIMTLASHMPSVMSNAAAELPSCLRELVKIILEDKDCLKE